MIPKDHHGNESGDEHLRILIIDDDAVDREIFKQYLNAGQPGTFFYEEAATGLDGLARLKTFEPDCILLDFNLPDVDGLSMIRYLLGDGHILPCAVVMLTGIGNEEVAVEAMKLGVMDYMAKGPASSQALSRTVASAIQRFRLQHEVAHQRRALEERNQELEAIRAELFDEKERYRTLAEAIPQLVWTTDLEGRVLYGNQRLWEFSGRDPGEILPLASLVHDEDRAELQEKWAEAIRSGTAFESELRLCRATDQSWRWHLMRSAPIRAAEMGLVRCFGTFTDIEDQKRAEEALRQRQKLDSIGLLAGGIAHDFNNLLVGIMGGASFALDSLDESHAAYPMLQIVLRSSERAAHLTQQLLAYSGKGRMFLEPVNISRITREACNTIRTSLPKDIQLEVEAAVDVPLVESNSMQMQQLVINLVMNGVEAIGEQSGVVKVRTAVESIGDGPRPNVLGYSLASGHYAVIEVTDSGNGMNQQTQSQMFDPFFTTKFTGRGLGLAAVHGIVRGMAGAIEVTSIEGAGSTFRILLPLQQPAVKQVLHKRAATDRRHGSKTVILLMKDPKILNTTATALRNAGHHYVAVDYDDADLLKSLVTQGGKIGLVLLDSSAPEARGNETLNQLRQLPPGIPVAVFVSESAQPLDGKFSGINIVELIQEPFTARSIEQTLSDLLLN